MQLLVLSLETDDGTKAAPSHADNGKTIKNSDLPAPSHVGKRKFYMIASKIFFVTISPPTISIGMHVTGFY
jgi:hypothetical protein